MIKLKRIKTTFRQDLKITILLIIKLFNFNLKLTEIIKKKQNKQIILISQINTMKNYLFFKKLF